LCAAGSREKQSSQADEQSRPDVLIRRQVWFDSQLALDLERLVFIDKTFASHKMARCRGRASPKPGDLVIMNNLTTHKSTPIRDAIEAVGARLLFLPPDSPEIIPIENAFAKLKALLGKAAARSIDQLWDAIARIIRTYSPQDCANYFAAAGYDADRSENALAITARVSGGHDRVQHWGQGHRAGTKTLLPCSPADRD
jgi:hypothetical protein